MVVDFHAHAFPDNIAERALKVVELKGGIKPKFDGTLKGLLYSMDRSGISISVVLSIATRPGQFGSILRWNSSIRSDRIIPFPSVHPDDRDILEHIHEIKNQGFKGLKMHPYFQDFYVDQEKMFPIYEAITAAGLILVLHSGFDFAFERVERANPQRILRVIEKFPEIKLVCAHLGGWQQWNDVEKFLIGKNIYIETSFSQDFLKDNQFERIILKHPSNLILFGTDTPWAEQKSAVQIFERTSISQDIKSRIFFRNAMKLLEINET
ncbi:MAG: amidohydrolase family protein [Candidatus Omnitrophica bacterium]|nr:amidohydrolase family protein [Candidatus Omnitrophota bacterium]MCM8789306.1 amidohydrolase family protein [Candidatus Omnitrophota bacterium]